mgnify:CR=1 FL=1
MSTAVGMRPPAGTMVAARAASVAVSVCLLTLAGIGVVVIGSPSSQVREIYRT